MSARPLGLRFLTVCAGQTVSSVGSAVAGIGVAIHVYVTTGNAAWLGLLGGLAALPYVLTGPLATHIDRRPRRTVMIAADAFAAIGPAVALALAVAGRLEVWHLVVAGFLGGLGNSVQWPASQAAIPALVDADVLDRANGFGQLGQSVGIVAGPFIAAPLVAVWGIEAVLLVDLVTFAVAVLTVLAVPFDDAPASAGVTDDGTWAAAWSWLRGEGRPLLGLIGVMAAVNFFLAFFNVALLVIATDVAGTAHAGIVIGAGGVAMLGGSLVVGARGVADDRVLTFARALLLVSVGCIVAAARPNLALVIVGVVIAIGMIPAVGASTSTLFQERVPSQMHGRVFALRSSVGRSFDPVGSVVAGFVIASVAAPAMAPGGFLADRLGRVIGTGEGRGAAVVLIGVGIAVGLGGGWLSRSWIRRGLATDPAGIGGDHGPLPAAPVDLGLTS